MAETVVLHVVARIHAGGPATCVLTEAELGARLGVPLRHELLALEPAASRGLLARALRARVRVHAGPDAMREAELVARADVVVLHYWNSPSVWSFLDRWRGRQARWVLYSRVNGRTPPQVLPPALAGSVAHLIGTSPWALGLRGDGAASVVPAVAVLPAPAPAAAADRASGRAARGQPQGLLHVGTLNVFKLDPAFIALHADAARAGAEVRVVGVGGDEHRFAAQAQRLGLAGSFTWAGYLADPWDGAGTAALCVAPTSLFSYASSDKAVQEATLRGLPVLTYAASPIAHLVEPGVTGLLARDRAHYTELLAELLEEADCAGSPRFPRAGVAAAARARHDPRPKVRQLAQIYASVREQPPRTLDPGADDLVSWVRGQLGPGPVSRPAATLEELAEDPAALLAVQRWGCEGGFAQFANAFPALRALREP